MRRSFSVLAGLGLVLIAAQPLAAQGSIFGIRGLGAPGRAVTARNAALGGSLGALEPMGMGNPGTLGLWSGLAGWGVGAPSYRSLTGPGIDSHFRSTRFPLFGFASAVRPRVTLGMTIGDYLDRNWSVQVEDTIVLRTDTVPYTDLALSLGGISDIRLATSWRVSPRLAAGIGVHAFIGSTRLSIQRAFSNPAYDDFIDISVTDFRALGVSLGAVLAPSSRLQLGASLKLAGEMRAENTSSGEARVDLPSEVTLGGSLVAVPGVSVSGTAAFQGWSSASDGLIAAGQPAMRDTWSAGVGVEVDRTTLLFVRTPVRVGYRWRQLPTFIAGAETNESAFSGGIGLSFAQGRTVVELAFESGSRSSGALKEGFQTVFFGVTVRP